VVNTVDIIQVSVCWRAYEQTREQAEYASATE
jgi:hypothetical protein